MPGVANSDEESIPLSNLGNRKSYNDNLQVSGTETQHDCPERNGISWYAATFLTVSSCVGIGVLELPWAYNVAGGLLPASIVHYVALALVTGGLVILIHIANITQACSYQEAMLLTLGNLGHKVCIITLVAEGAMECVVLLVVAGDYIEKFVASVISEEFVTTWYGNQKSLVTILGVLILLPMCLMREIKGLRYTSYLGFAATTFITSLVVVKYFLRSTDAACFNNNATWIDSLFIAPGVSASYMCHYLIMAVFGAMIERNTKGYAKTSVATILICTVFNTLIPVFGYLTFGNAISKDVILSYLPTADIYITYFALALKCFLTIPVIFFCVRSALQDLWLAVWSVTPSDAVHGERKRRTCIGVTGFIIILGIYIAVPDIVSAIAYAGGLGFLYSCVFPGLSLFKSVVDRPRTEIHKATKAFLIAVGVFYVTCGILFFGGSMVQEILSYQ